MSDRAKQLVIFYGIMVFFTAVAWNWAAVVILAAWACFDVFVVLQQAKRRVE